MVEEIVGYVYSSDGNYFPDRVEVSLLAGREVFRGEYLYIRQPSSSKNVFLQVETALVRRPSATYEEKLIRDGIIRQDPEKITGKAVCWQIGYEDHGMVRPLLTPIPPLTPVYRPSEQELISFLTSEGPSITVGRMYPTQIPINLSLKPLFRQGALIIGGVGTGKSTLLLSLMINMLTAGHTPGIRILLIDWDGEYNSEHLRRAAETAGGYRKITSSTRINRRKTVLSFREWYDRFRKVTGKSGQEKSMRTLYAILKQAEESGEPGLQWSREAYQKILQRVQINEVKQELEALTDIVFKDGQGEGLDIISLIQENALVHVDFTDAQSWDEIINKTGEILETCYTEARTNERFGVAVFIDEAHNFIPQSVHEGAASREAYESMIPLMKLVATTGPRNGMPLFIATQRLSEVDKFISTQMGQNTFAFRVEDVDLERLRGVMGSDIAYSARYLPRGYCIYKGHGLKIQRPVIIEVEKLGDVASVGKDLLTRLSSMASRIE